LADSINSMQPRFAQKTNCNKYFNSIDINKLFKQPELARTLKPIALHGADNFYRGKTAKLIIDEMQRSGGLISIEDVHQYKALWRDPKRVKWQNYEIISAPPPRSDGFAIVQLLKMNDYLADQFADTEPQFCTIY
jgi:gamma-glutamyltranspeptidase/glutathione hydrolase